MKGKRKRIMKKYAQLPGYPRYPASEDIINTNERVFIDENTTPTEGVEALELQNGVADTTDKKESNPPRKPDPLDLEKDKESELTDRVEPIDFTGEDLDVPGTELDDESEKTGNEDEENNLYSRGDSD
jgi:hypothetical protein